MLGVKALLGEVLVEVLLEIGEVVGEVVQLVLVVLQQSITMARSQQWPTYNRPHSMGYRWNAKKHQDSFKGREA